jgi:hypothetical protein
MARHPDAAVVVPPRSSTVPSDTAGTAPTQRRASAVYRRARPHRLAEGLGIHLACSGGSRYCAMEMRHWRWVTLVDGRAASDRSSHCCQRPEPHAGPRTPRVCPDRVTRNTGRTQRARSADPCNTLRPGASTRGGPAPAATGPMSKWRQQTECTGQVGEPNSEMTRTMTARGSTLRHRTVDTDGSLSSYRCGADPIER